MPGETRSLAQTVKAMRPMMPATDFERSERAMTSSALSRAPLTDRLTEIQLDGLSFILQAHSRAR